MKILQLDASIQGTAGYSAQLTEALVTELRRQYPDAEVLRRDLAADPLPHLDAQTFAASRHVEQTRSAEEHKLLERADALIAELQSADLLVLGVPMYNFGIPSTLKAWIDHVARAGVTFRYTADGPQGLLTGKRAWVLAARGGRYAGTGADNQAPYLRQVLAFLGIDDVRFVYAEGLASSQVPAQQIIADAIRAGREHLAA